ncbi:hypothetical protein [Dialister hominis]|uniref:hypothetical protein n=1 Tax=Dialister hominis TaxID=2582419 RepID=UPI003FED87F5
MDTCSIGKSSSVVNKLLNQILNYIGADCTVLGYFHYFIKKPRGSRSEVNAIEIKLDDPRLDDLRFEDTYEITVALKIASGYLRKSRYFILSEILDNWSEITKAEFKALDVLDNLDVYECIEYDPERCEAVVIGKNSKFTCFNIDTDYEFLQMVDAMDYIRSGDLYTRIKEAKHE